MVCYAVFSYCVIILVCCHAMSSHWCVIILCRHTGALCCVVILCRHYGVLSYSAVTLVRCHIVFTHWCVVIPCRHSGVLLYCVVTLVCCTVLSGTFLLTELLLDKLKSSCPSRIVNTAAAAAGLGTINFTNINLASEYTPGKAFAQSKMAILIYTLYLAEKLKGGHSTERGTLARQAH